MIDFTLNQLFRPFRFCCLQENTKKVIIMHVYGTINTIQAKIKDILVY